MKHMRIHSNRRRRIVVSLALGMALSLVTVVPKFAYAHPG